MRKRACIRILMTALMVMSLVISCSKVNHIQEKKEIVMSPFGTSLTKAEQGPLEQDKVFGVFAYYAKCPGGTAWDNPMAWASSSLYLEDVAFSHQSGSWAGRDQAYYWPFEGSLMFAGYCPHQSVSNNTVTSVDLVPNAAETNPYLQIGFTQDPSAMVDLLWFDVKDVAAGTALENSDVAIPVTFRHALSKVSFSFSDSRQIYSLKYVTLKGLVNQGTFYSGSTSGWLPELAQNTLADYSLLTEDTATPPYHPKLHLWTSADQYIIPQYLDGIFPTIGVTLDSGVDVVLEFMVTDGFGSQKIEIQLKECTERWELGKSYHYTITANAYPIEFGMPTFTVETQTVSM